MPNYDEIEHEGTEDFPIFQNRTTDKQHKEKVKIEKEEQKETRKEKLQEIWMSVENPFLWEGDLDN